MAQFSGKRVLVTGGTNGIGLAEARRLADEGAQVMVTGTNSERVESARSVMPGVRAWSNDAADPDTGTALAARIAEAGYADIADVNEVTAEFFDRMRAVNVRAAFPDSRADTPSQRWRFDRADFLDRPRSRDHPWRPSTRRPREHPKQLPAAFANRNIQVNILVPGNVDTDFGRFMDDDTWAMSTYLHSPKSR